MGLLEKGKMKIWWCGGSGMVQLEEVGSTDGRWRGEVGFC